MLNNLDEMRTKWNIVDKQHWLPNVSALIATMEPPKPSPKKKKKEKEVHCWSAKRC